MNIRNTRQLKQKASQRLQNCTAGKRLVLIYTGLLVALSLAATILSQLLSMQIDQLGGLGNMGKRTFFSSVQLLMPIAQSMVSTCLQVGFLAAMLRIARGQYVSAQTLRLGFDRFWLLMRSTVFQCLIYSAASFAAAYLGMMIFMISPLSRPAMELLAPYVSDPTLLSSALVLDDAFYAQFFQAVWPLYLICGIALCVVCIPIAYSYRMVNYIIIDKPGIGALAALRESKRMMRGNRLALFKLDLSMWWFYAALLAVSVLCYGDSLLPMLGITLPVSETVSFFLFYILYLLVLTGIYYLVLDRVEVTYAQAYEALKPEEPRDSGVVLGNIFQM